MTARAVRLSAVEKSFGSDIILKGVDLSIAPGEFVSLVGASGSGKSTLLRIIAGLETPDHGAVSIDGRDVTSLDPSDRNLAMVFQSYALYPHMSARRNIATPLRMRRLSALARLPFFGRATPGHARLIREIDADVERAAQTLQISALLDRKPSQLSGGQRQRVALARALVREPAAFLMDEPLSNLDASLRSHMRDELAALHRRLGATFIYVTHDQIEAMTMSDRIAMLEGGQVLQYGPPSELYERPANLAVARFIGAPTINLLPVTVEASGSVSFAGKPLGMAASGARGDATLGLRPEDVRLVASGETRAIAAMVARVERHGADRYVHLDVQGANGPRVLARQNAGEGPEPAIGLVTGVDFPRDRAHLFGADGTRRALSQRLAA